MVLNRLAGQANSGTSYGNSINGQGTVAVRFTPSSTITINAVRVNRMSAMVNPAVIGIASALGANPGAITWVSKSTTANLNGTGQMVNSIPEVTLNSGTNYYLIIQANGGTDDAYNLSTSGGGATSLFNITSPQISASVNATTAWSGALTSYIPQFDVGTAQDVGTVNGSYTSGTPLDALLNSGNLGQRIVPSANMSIGGGAITFKSAPGAGTLTVGISSSISASPPYIGKGTITTTAGTAAGTTVTCEFDNVCNLVQGTTYYFVVQTTNAIGDKIALTNFANLSIAGFTNGLNNKGGLLYNQAGFGSTDDTYRLLFSTYAAVVPTPPVVGGSSKSIMEAILAAKRAAQGASSDKLTIDDVNYKDRKSTGPVGTPTSQTINDLWYARWGNLGEKTTINDRMYKFFGGTVDTMAAHKTISDLLAEWFHAAGRP